MELSQLRDHLEERLEYPVDHAEARAALEDVTVEGDDEATRALSTLLDEHAHEEFASANELHQTILGGLPDEYVGPKYYDDRGSNPASMSEDGPDDQTNSL